MIKSEELSNPASCLNKAADDEPVFVLRAQDLLAPDIVHDWADIAEKAGVPFEKVNEARRCAVYMRDWQDHHSAKVPD